MFFPYETISALSDLIRGINTIPPWSEADRFFTSLHRVIPFDYSVAFVKIDPATFRVVPSSLTLSNGGWNDAGLLLDYNRHFWRFKTGAAPFSTGRLHSRPFPIIPKQVLSKSAFQEHASDFCQKHRIGYYCVRPIRTPEGPTLLSFGRPPGNAEFSGEERRLLEYLAPHLELIAATARPETPILFAERRGTILTADPNADAEMQRNPNFAATLRKALPVWAARLSANPLEPFHAVLREGGKTARFALSPAGTRHSLLLRVTWRWSP